MKIKIKTNYNLDEFNDKGEKIEGDSLTEPCDDYTVPELIYLFQTGQKKAQSTGGYDYEYNSKEDYIKDDLDIDDEEPTQVFDKDVADAQADLERMTAKAEQRKSSRQQAATKQAESAAESAASVAAQVDGAAKEQSSAAE